MASIQLHNIAKRFGSFVGVEDMTLDIADEEFLVLLGPSGCGKTTTMRMIAGLEEPTEGEIVIGGEAVNAVDARDRDVAMVFQGYALYPNMSIYENIRFPLRMRGVPKADHDRLIREAAGMVELEAFLDRKPGALSGGQRQRAALARAVVRQPQVFLMDEPLSNLDAKLRQSMRVQIKHMQRTLRVTTVYVTHDQIEAMTLADRIVIMNRGAIQQVGTPDQIYSDPANTFVAGFIGSPPMNLVEGTAQDGRFTAPGVSAPCPAQLSGPVTLGVRPEDCAVGGDHIEGTVYGVEPTGDITYLTVRAGGRSIEVKAARDFRASIDSPIGIALDPAPPLLLRRRGSAHRAQAMSPAFDYTSMGFITFDALCRPVTQIPPGGDTYFVDELTLAVSGAAGSAVIVAAKHGLRCRAVGGVGNDDMGDWVLMKLASFGIDVAMMDRCEGFTTSSSLVTVRPDGARPALHKRGATDGFFIGDDRIDTLLDTRILHTGGVGLMNRMDPSRTAEILAEAKRRGVLTTLDVFASTPDDLPKVRRLLPHTDYFIPSREEAQALSGLETDPDLARFLLDLGTGCVILTLGAEGAFYSHSDGTAFHIPAFDVEVVCTCGCGDCFNGGFATGLLTGLSPEEAVIVAQASSAQNATGLGSQAGVRDYATTRAFIDRTPQRGAASRLVSTRG